MSFAPAASAAAPRMISSVSVGRSDPLAVVGQVDGGLDPDRAVVGGVLDHLAGEAGEGVGRGQRGAGGHVHPRKRREGPEAADRGHLDTRLGGHLVQRRGPHRALEVDVKVGFGEAAEVTHPRDDGMPAVEPSGLAHGMETQRS